MKGQNFASQVLSRHTFRISRKKGSDFFDHRGTLKPEKYSGLNGIRTHDLCDTGAVLYQLSYQANWEAGHFVSS